MAARRIRVGTAAAGLALGVLLTACGGANNLQSGAGGGNTAAGSAPPDAAGRSVAQGLDRASKGAGTAVVPTTVQTREVIRTGTVSMIVGTLVEARDRIDAMLARYGGYVSQEETFNDGRGRPARSRLVLRVPAPSFETVMADLGQEGRVLRSERSAEDVTTEVIDVGTRVAAQEASLARLRAFLGRARSMTDIIRLESEIANRQAGLESLQAQQKYLADQTALSTITLDLSTPAPPAERSNRDTGFLVGLRTGWNALVTDFLGLATLLGAVLPFALTVAVVGVPAWVLVRASMRRASRRRAAQEGWEGC